jgi:hypothetical protein
MSEKYYKVVTNNYNRLFSSFVVDGGPTDFIVEYFVGEWSYPTIKKTRLFVFNDFIDAENFAVLSLGHSIYECEVKNPRKNPTIMSRFSCIQKYWELRFQKKKTGHFCRNSYLSSGCSSCDAVKLIKKVK